MSSDQSPKIWIIVPAAGIGSRMGADLPKQYLPLGSATVLEKTLSVLVCANYLAGVIVCVHRDDTYFDSLSFQHPKIIKALGGAQRSATVLCGLKKIESLAAPTDWVLVHDAARPCLKVTQLNDFIDNILEQNLGGILAVPVADTLKLVEPASQQVLCTQDRANLWQAQTPQMFQFSDISLALNSALQQEQAITDEASAIEALGKVVRIIPGSAENIKITRPEDLHLAALILRANH